MGRVANDEVGKTKSGFKRFKEWAGVAALIVIPTVQVLAGWVSSNRDSDLDFRAASAQVDAKYVELALQILRTDDAPELQNWAVSVINQTSPVPLSDDASEQLGARLSDECDALISERTRTAGLLGAATQQRLDFQQDVIDEILGANAEPGVGPRAQLLRDLEMAAAAEVAVLQAQSDAAVARAFDCS